MLGTLFRLGQRLFHGLVGIEMVGRISQAVVQNHDDVGAKRSLYIHRDLWTEKVTTSVQVRLKTNPVVADVSQRTETEDLVSAAVGQNRPIPTHESVQSSKLRHGFVARSQKEVVRVAEEDFDIETPK